MKKFKRFLDSNFKVIVLLGVAIIISELTALLLIKKRIEDVAMILTPFAALISAWYIYRGFQAALKNNKITTDKPEFEELQLMLEGIQKQMINHRLFINNHLPHLHTLLMLNIRKTNYLKNFLDLVDASSRIKDDIKLQQLLEKDLKNYAQCDNDEKIIIQDYNMLYDDINKYLNFIHNSLNKSLNRIKKSEIIPEYKKLLIKKIPEIL